MNEFTEQPTSADRSSWPKPAIRKLASYLAAVALVVLVLSLILASPLLLRQIAEIKGIDWEKLSNIGQTYGAASAILSAIALIGVALSLIVQARQAGTERVRITRERHIELLRIILDAPEVYGPVIGTEAGLSGIDPRRFIFCTMWVNYARLGFQAGVLTEQVLHDDIFGPAFESEPMRKWWARSRKYWSSRDLTWDRQEQRFVQIIDEEYRKAEAAGPPTIPDTSSRATNARPTANKHFKDLTGPALGVTIGIVIGFTSKEVWQAASQLSPYGKRLIRQAASKISRTGRWPPGKSSRRV